MSGVLAEPKLNELQINSGTAHGLVRSPVIIFPQCLFSYGVSTCFFLVKKFARVGRGFLCASLNRDQNGQ